MHTHTHTWCCRMYSFMSGAPKTTQSTPLPTPIEAPLYLFIIITALFGLSHKRVRGGFAHHIYTHSTRECAHASHNTIFMSRSNCTCLSHNRHFISNLLFVTFSRLGRVWSRCRIWMCYYLNQHIHVIQILTLDKTRGVKGCDHSVWNWIKFTWEYIPETSLHSLL